MSSLPRPRPQLNRKGSDSIKSLNSQEPAQPEPLFQQTIPDGPPREHDRYYFNDDMVVFLVEDRLFRIHRHFLLRESDGFTDVLNVGDDVIPLPDVTCKEFEVLLDFFYWGMHDDHHPSLKDWIAILSMSTQFGFRKLRERAIREIDDAAHRKELKPVQKIVLAQKYDVPQWPKACYEALCQRTQGLTNAEAELLGATVTNCIWKAREMVREEAHPTQGSQGAVWHPNQGEAPATEWDVHNYNATTVSQVVQKVFWSPKLTWVSPPPHTPPSHTPPPSTPPPESTPTMDNHALPASSMVHQEGILSWPEPISTGPLPPKSIDLGFLGKRLTKKKRKDNLAVIVPHE